MHKKCAYTSSLGLIKTAPTGDMYDERVPDKCIYGQPPPGWFFGDIIIGGFAGRISNIFLFLYVDVQMW